MRHFLRRLPAGNQVGAGNTTTFQVPLGPTYRDFNLRPKIAGVDATEAQMRAQMTQVRCKINGIQRWGGNGGRLIDLYEYYGFTLASGVFPMLFSRPNARTIVAEENSCLGTGNVDSLTIEVDLDAAATIDSIDLDAVYTPEKRDLGPLIEVHENTFTAGAAGTFEISTLPRSRGDLVGMHLFSSLITAFELEVDAVTYFDGDLTTLNNVLTRTGRAPVTNVVHYEPAYLDRYDDGIPLRGVQDFRQKLTMSGAGSVPIMMETLNVPIQSSAQRA